MQAEVRPTPPRSVAVFLGAGRPAAAWPWALAKDTALALAHAKWDVVYGGANVGLMGAFADAALAAGCRVVGVIPQALREREIAHPSLSELLLVDDMNQRKAEMVRRASAFLILPGGFGTFDELFEVATLAQLGQLHAPIILLNSHGFFDGLLTQFDTALELGVLRPEHHALLSVAQTLPEALHHLKKTNA
ncbi:MAG: TIGR00730 family Rossman fold protein [Polyangiaceae bacterium]